MRRRRPCDGRREDLPGRVVIDAAIPHPRQRRLREPLSAAQQQQARRGPTASPPPRCPPAPRPPGALAPAPRHAQREAFLERGRAGARRSHQVTSRRARWRPRPEPLGQLSFVAVSSRHPVGVGW
jgi:hypothetical protein